MGNELYLYDIIITILIVSYSFLWVEVTDLIMRERERVCVWESKRVREWDRRRENERV